MGGWSSRCWLSAILLGVALTATAQQHERPRLPPEIEALRNAAPGAPPELAADILLKLVEWGLVPSKPDRLELIEQAFQFASAAKYPFAQTAAVDEARHTDSAPGLRVGALEHGFSAIGLRCRAVRAALPLDRAKAVQLFERITVGPFPALTCRDALVPSLNEYYTTLREVALNGFAADQRRKGRHLQLLESAVRSAVIPAQLEPLAKLAAEYPEFIPAFAASLKLMDADPRSFGALTFALGQAVVNLSEHLHSGGGSTVSLAGAFRSHVTKHLQGVVCEETLDPKTLVKIEAYIDKTASSQAGAKETAPLVISELKPRSVDGHAVIIDSWRTGRSREIMAQYKSLRFGTKEQQDEYNKRERRKDGMSHFLPEDLRRTPAWEAKAWDFLNELDRWNKNHTEPEAHFFHQLSLQYGGLMDIVPPGPLLNTVFQAYISFLKSSPLERESPPEWLLHVQRLFVVTDASKEHQAWIREQIRKNGSLTMSLYAELARLNPSRN